MKRILILLSALYFYTLADAQTQITLVPAQKSGGMPLMEALSKRSTSRSFDTLALSNQQLSNLLWASFGINRSDGKRTAPSARNFQETDIYIILKQGTYLYNAKNHSLIQIIGEDLRHLGGTQPFVKDAPLTLIFVADLAKLGNGKPEDKMNTANIDVGYISQNVYLYCASEGLATGARGSVDRTTLGFKLNLKESQAIILAQSVGYPKK